MFSCFDLYFQCIWKHFRTFVSLCILVHDKADRHIRMTDVLTLNKSEGQTVKWVTKQADTNGRNTQKGRVPWFTKFCHAKQ